MKTKVYVVLIPILFFAILSPKSLVSTSEEDLDIGHRQLEVRILWRFRANDKLRCSPALADLNNDGIIDVVVGSKDNNVYVLSGNNGSLIWNYTAFSWIATSPVVGDINGDNKLEVIIGDGNGSIHVLSGSDGELIWRRHIGSLIAATPAIGDIDGDGDIDIVVGTEDGVVYVLSGADGSTIWRKFISQPVPPFVYFTGSPIIADVNADGESEIIVGVGTALALNFSDAILVLRGDDGSILWSGGRRVDSSSCATIWAMCSPSTAAVGDLNGDGILDIVVSDVFAHTIAFDGANGRLLWFSGTTNHSKMTQEVSPVIVDIDGDGKLDVVSVSYDPDINRNTLVAYRGADGETIWCAQFWGQIRWSSPAVVDLNRDGTPDVIVGDKYGKIYAVDGADGKTLWIFYAGDCIDSPPVVGDLDNDGDLEIVFTCFDNYTYALDVPGATFPRNRVYWGVFMGNPHHTGNVEDIDQDGDCLSDFSESLYGSSPVKYDTDDDGYSDGIEVFYGTDPVDALNHPGNIGSNIFTIIMVLVATCLVVLILVLKYRKIIKR